MSGESTFSLSQRATQHFDRGEYRQGFACAQQALSLVQQRGSPDPSELGIIELLVICSEATKDRVEYATIGIAAARRHKDVTLEIVFTFHLADALLHLDSHARWKEVRTLLLDGLEKARAIQHNGLSRMLLFGLGRGALDVRHPEEGYRWLQEALDVYAREPGVPTGPLVDIYRELSDWARDRGDRGEALRYAEMAVGTAREIGNPDFVAKASWTLAGVRRWRGERSEALELAEAMLDTWRRLGFEWGIVNSLSLKTRLLAELGLQDKASACFRELESMPLRVAKHYIQVGLAAYRAFRDLGAAERAYRECLDKDPKESSAWNCLAQALYDGGRVDEAVRCWREALKVRNLYPDALAGLALGLWTQDRREEAVKVFGQALGLDERYGDPAYLAEESYWTAAAIERARPMMTRARPTAASKEEAIS